MGTKKIAGSPAKYQPAENQPSETKKIPGSLANNEPPNNKMTDPLDRTFATKPSPVSNDPRWQESFTTWSSLRTLSSSLFEELNPLSFDKDAKFCQVKHKGGMFEGLMLNGKRHGL